MCQGTSAYKLPKNVESFCFGHPSQRSVRLLGTIAADNHRVRALDTYSYRTIYYVFQRRSSKIYLDPKDPCTVSFEAYCIWRHDRETGNRASSQDMDALLYTFPALAFL
jgi:hypothetical protein